MNVKLFNIHYFIYILISIGIIAVSYALLRNQSDKVKERALFYILLFGFIIHFLKMFIYPYTTIPFPQRFRKVSFENISATHTLLFPWIFLSKNKALRDYLVMGGMTSGLVPILFPLDAMSPTFDGHPFLMKEAYSIEVIRFYVAHLIMFLVPFLMMAFKLHQVSAKNSYLIPLIFMGVLIFLYFNEMILVKTGLVPSESLYDPNDRNPSFIFGIRDDVLKYAGFMLVFVPPFMRQPVYWPVVWMFIPVMIYGTLFTLGYTLIYDRKGLKALFRKIVFHESIDYKDKQAE